VDVASSGGGDGGSAGGVLAYGGDVGDGGKALSMTQAVGTLRIAAGEGDKVVWSGVTTLGDIGTTSWGPFVMTMPRPWEGVDMEVRLHYAGADGGWMATFPLVATEEWGVGETAGEAVEDLVQSMAGYQCSLAGREGRLAEGERGDLGKLREMFRGSEREAG